VDQNYNNSQNDFLWTLLANPADDARSHNYNLQRLVNDFPQSGILQALLAHSSDEKNLKQASAYFNSRALYKLINAPSSFIGVADEKIIVQGNINSGSWAGYKQPEAEPQAEPEITENYFSVPHPDEAAHEAAATMEEYRPEIAHEPTHETVYEHHTPQPVAAPEHEFIEEQVEHALHSEPTYWEQQEAEMHQGVAEEHTNHTEHQAFAEPVYEHQPDAEAHLAEPVAAGAEAHEPEPISETHTGEPVVIAEHVPETPETAEHQPTEEPHSRASIFSEIKELMNDTPYSEPIINYAAGLGKKMPVEAEEKAGHEYIAAQPEATAQAHEEHHQAAENNYEQPSTEAPAPEHIHEEQTYVAEHQHQKPTVEEAHLTSAPTEHTHVSEQEQPAQHETDPHEYTFTDPVAAEYNGFAEPAEEHNQQHEAHHQPEEQYQTFAEAPAEHQVIVEPEPAAAAQNEIIEDETFDEIVGIENIGIEPDIIGNIAATDYFSFDRTFGAHKTPEPVNERRTGAAGDNADDQQDVSKYHDEKMPYSFLWWLDKTRKEHASVYQPYVAPPVDPAASQATPAGDALQQQYYENIFHITSFEEFERSAPLPPPYASPIDHKRKEQSIIDRFIQEEPQIRPQSSDKLDNENKAKKSSEDRDELVSETLAAIYSDQMLYHKAIASYKKLMLRFPEKSRYFADKIEQLEKKTN